MSVSQDKISVTRQAGEALFVSGCLSYDSACANEVSASTAQHSTAQHSTAQHSTAQHSTAQHSTEDWNVSNGQA